MNNSTLTTSGVVLALIQPIVVLLFAPLLVGIMRKVRARLEGRAGPSIWQPWRDIRKLLRKERIKPQFSSWVFNMAPLVLLASAVVVSALIPIASTDSGLDVSGDLFAVVYLLLLGTVFLALAGLDPGTAFGGMGSSRESTIAALAEPTLLTAIFALSVPAHSTNLANIVGFTLDTPSMIASPESLLALSALAVVTLAENARIPVDNPSTHLELTMVHEAMILEYAGPDLALVETASWARLFIYLALLANLFVPWGIATTAQPLEVFLGAGATVAKVTVLGVGVAAGEVWMAKLRLFRVPELLAASFLLALLAVTASFFLA